MRPAQEGNEQKHGSGAVELDALALMLLHALFDGLPRVVQPAFHRAFADLHGLGDLISQHAKIKVRLAEHPVECVAIGTALSFSKLDELYDGFVTPSTHTH